MTNPSITSASINGESVLQRVVYVIDVDDRPGIMHAIAAVFSHRGLSMQALVADTHRQQPRILVVFEGTGRQCQLVEQVLARLHDVQQIRTLRTDAPELRAFAICRLNGPLMPETVPDVGVQRNGNEYQIFGSYDAVDAALRRLQQDAAVDAVSRSLVVL